MSEEKQFFFNCQASCGDYPVTEETFRDFLCDEMLAALLEEFSKGAIGARLTLEDSCPKCAEKGSTRGILSVLRPKVH